MNATVYREVPGVVTIAEESTAWPGVTRPDPPRRPGLRLQVEHGLDARLAGLRRAGAGLPQLPPRPADVLDDLRLLRELRAADQPRRGRLRQGLAAAEDARRPVAAAGQPARLPAPTCGPTPASSCCSWARSSPRTPSGPRAARWTGGTSTTPRTAASCSWSPTSTAATSELDALWSQDVDPAGFQWIDANDAVGQRAVLPAVRQVGRPRRTAAAEDAAVGAGLRGELRRARRTTSTGSGCPGPGHWREVLNTDAEGYGGSGVGNLGGVEAVAEPWHGQPYSATIAAPPLGDRLVPARGLRREPVATAPARGAPRAASDRAFCPAPIVPVRAGSSRQGTSRREAGPAPRAARAPWACCSPVSTRGSPARRRRGTGRAGRRRPGDVPDHRRHRRRDRPVRPQRPDRPERPSGPSTSRRSSARTSSRWRAATSASTPTTSTRRAYPETGIGCGCRPAGRRRGQRLLLPPRRCELDSISYDRALPRRARPTSYGRFIPALVMAHEFGHAVQGRVGLRRRPSIAGRDPGRLPRRRLDRWVADGRGRARLRCGPRSSTTSSAATCCCATRSAPTPTRSRRTAPTSTGSRPSRRASTAASRPAATTSATDRLFTQRRSTTTTTRPAATRPYGEISTIVDDTLPEFWDRSSPTAFGGDFDAARGRAPSTGRRRTARGAEDRDLVYCADETPSAIDETDLAIGLPTTVGDFALATALSHPLRAGRPRPARPVDRRRGRHPLGGLPDRLVRRAVFQRRDDQPGAPTISPGDIDEAVQFLLAYGDDPRSSRRRPHRLRAGRPFRTASSQGLDACGLGG